MVKPKIDKQRTASHMAKPLLEAMENCGHVMGQNIAKIGT